MIGESTTNENGCPKHEQRKAPAKDQEEEKEQVTL